MIQTFRFAVVGAAVTAAFGLVSTAHAATSATADATAEILEAVAVVADGTDLDFGTIAIKNLPSGTATITLSPANTLTCATSTFVCAGTTSVPTFDVTGYNGANVAVSFTNSSINLTGPGANMPLALTSSASSVTLDGSGEGSFTVGGTLTVNSGQVAGVYTGQMEVNVQYQ